MKYAKARPPVVNVPSTVFLDRDGVINVDSPDYVKNWNEFHFIPGSLEAIARLTQNGISVIIITNQSGINRRIIPLEELEGIHRRLKQAVRDSDGRVTDIFYCPHRPDEGCECRKPKPGLIVAARRRYSIDLSRTIMVGDSDKDVLAGQAAGCGGTILIKTGNGTCTIQTLETTGTRPDHVAADLLQAVKWIVGPHRYRP